MSCIGIFIFKHFLVISYYWNSRKVSAFSLSCIFKHFLVNTKNSAHTHEIIMTALMKQKVYAHISTFTSPPTAHNLTVQKCGLGIKKTLPQKSDGGMLSRKCWEWWMLSGGFSLAKMKQGKLWMKWQQKTGREREREENYQQQQRCPCPCTYRQKCRQCPWMPCGSATESLCLETLFLENTEIF